MASRLQTWQLRLILSSVTNVSISDLEQAPPHRIRLWLKTIDDRLKRERNRGLARHYRYDLQRHIALADARSKMRALLDSKESSAPYKQEAPIN